MAVQTKFAAIIIYLLGIIVWVCMFLTQRICPVLYSFFRTGNSITGGSNRGGGWGVVNVGVYNGD